MFLASACLRFPTAAGIAPLTVALRGISLLLGTLASDTQGDRDKFGLAVDGSYRVLTTTTAD